MSTIGRREFHGRATQALERLLLRERVARHQPAFRPLDHLAVSSVCFQLLRLAEPRHGQIEGGASSAGRSGLGGTPSARLAGAFGQLVVGWLVNSTTGQPAFAVTSDATVTPSPSGRPTAQIATCGRVR